MEITITEVLQGILTIVMTIGIKYLSGLKSSVDELNIKMAEVILQIGFHEERIKHLEREQNNKMGG